VDSWIFIVTGSLLDGGGPGTMPRWPWLIPSYYVALKPWFPLGCDWLGTTGLPPEMPIFIKWMMPRAILVGCTEFVSMFTLITI
jgi:hypothetical protein